MGSFYTSCIVQNHTERDRIAAVPRILVDTGSEHTVDTGNTAGADRDHSGRKAAVSDSGKRPTCFTPHRLRDRSGWRTVYHR